MDKEKAKDYFVDMIQKSWTYARLTKKEKENLSKVFNSSLTESCLKGTYEQRWAILNGIYHSFLMALDYNATNWREENEDIPLF